MIKVQFYDQMFFQCFADSFLTELSNACMTLKKEQAESETEGVS